MEIELRGVDELGALARRLRQAANRDLRLELYRELRGITNPIRAAVRRSARSTLPRRGGLAALVAGSKIRVERRLGGGSGVTIRMVGASQHDIAAMNRGIVRHPLFADRTQWFEQAVPPRWWDKPTEASEPTGRAAVARALDNVARKL